MESVDSLHPSDWHELTCSQDQIWLGQRHYGPSPLYNLTFAFHVPEPIRLECFQTAHQRLVHEADCLRLRITEIEGRAFQRIDPQGSVPLTIVDFSPSADPQGEFEKWARAMSQRPVDFSRLVLASSLVLLSGAQAVWVITVHHIVADSWGLYRLYCRLIEIYTALQSGKPLPQPALPPYRLLLDCDQEYRASEQFLADHRYWSRKTAAANGPLKLYGKAGQPAIRTTRRVEFEIDPRLVQRMRQMIETTEYAGKTANVALFNLLFTAFAAFLYRVSGQPSFMIGVPHLNRPGRLRDAAGLTTQQVPLAVSIDPQETYTTLHHKVREESAETARHSQHPVPNAANHVYNIVFNYHNRPYRSTGYRCEKWWYSGSDDDDLVLNVLNPEADGNKVRIGFDLANDLFDPQAEKRLIRHFTTVLEALVEAPDSPITHVSLLTADERAAILAENPPLFQPSGKWFIDHFETQVKDHPDLIAIEAGGDQLTYRQLDSQARLLSSHLRRLGIGPGKTIGLYIDRSISLAAGIIAILGAGNTYVPLDPSYPADRLRWTCQDAGISCILTRAALLDACPICNVRLIAIDTLADQDAITPAPPDWVHPEPDSPAYIIYTSGSTGRPKGVVVSHRQMMSYEEVEMTYLSLRPGDRFLFFAALGFDASMVELFPAWMAGATVVVRPNQLPSLAEFDLLIENRHITILQLPAAYWSEWVNSLELRQAAVPPQLRLLLVYAEEPCIARYQAWKKHDPLGKIRWINTYGPTEAVVDATTFEPSRTDDPSTWQHFPIGKPIRNHAVYILDQNRELVPLGTPGEIYVGGDISTGYLNQPAATAAVFVPDPFRESTGAKMYKTGDRGRYAGPGVIEFLGRDDFQVKLHGFRIELGEIENILLSYPGIRQAVVVLKKNACGAEHLIAYITLNSTAPFDPAGVRDYLKGCLPNYMLPSSYVLLPELPVTVNGKIDRQALPEVVEAEAGNEARGASTASEARLVTIWQQLLGVSPIGVEDDFFDLGGDSLLGVRLFDMIRHQMGVWLPVASLFKGSTIRQLAQLVDQGEQANPVSCAVLLRAGAGKTPLFLIHGWGGGVAGYAELARRLDPQMPVYGVQAAGLLGEQAPDETMEASVERYVKAIKSVQPAGPYRIGGYCTGGVIAYAVACALVEQGDPVSLVAIIEGNAPRVDLTCPPLLAPRRLYQFVKSIPFWMVDYRALGFTGIRQRMLKIIQMRKIRRRQTASEPVSYQMADIIRDDPTPLPDYQNRLLLAELILIDRYRPAPYPGEVVVFKAAYPTISQAVHGPLDPTLG